MVHAGIEQPSDIENSNRLCPMSSGRDRTALKMADMTSEGPLGFDVPGSC